MSKYDALTAHLRSRTTGQVPMTFAEIERLLGFPLPPSSRTHRAWWSNNPQNNVMTRAWLTAGFRTEAVDISGRKLVFRRVAPVPPRRARADPAEAKVDHVAHPAFGCMAGTITIADDFDPGEPADPDWARLLERGQL